MSFVQIKQIVKTFDATQALKGVSFEIPRGSIFGLLGPNGAGKTTLIRIINQIFLPDSGEIYIDNKPLSSQLNALMGYLPEERGLYRKMKVGEHLVFLAQLKGLSRYDATQRSRQWLEKLEIADWWNKPIEQLSKGMAQKVQFISTVLHNPSLLIFDEPFSGFDPLNVDIIENLIKELQQQGTTIIFSAHNMASVEQICDRIVLINKGQIILQGDIYEIKKQFSRNLYIVSFEIPIPQNIADNYALKPFQDTYPNSYTIELKSHQEISEFLTSITKVAHIEHFNKYTPSLHEIFVTQVKLFNQNTNQNE